MKATVEAMILAQARIGIIPEVTTSNLNAFEKACRRFGGGHFHEIDSDGGWWTWESTQRVTRVLVRE